MFQPNGKFWLQHKGNKRLATHGPRNQFHTLATEFKFMAEMMVVAQLQPQGLADGAAKMLGHPSRGGRRWWKSFARVRPLGSESPPIPTPPLSFHTFLRLSAGGKAFCAHKGLPRQQLSIH